MEIKGLIETSFLDWEGKIVCTQYVPKCNFRCPFCYNYELILNPDKFETIPFEKIKELLIEHKDFLDGICTTGGEPTVYNDLPEFLLKIKKLGFKTKLDTNGSIPEMLKKVLNEKLVDYIAMDIKAPLDERYEKSAGVFVDLEKLCRSIKLIMNSKIDYEFRTTVVPTLLNKRDIIDITKAVKGAEKFVLQQFQPPHALDENLRKLKPYDAHVLKEMAKEVKKYVKNVKIRGLKE